MIYINGGTRNQRKYAYSIAQFVCDKFDVCPDVEINFKRLTNDVSVGGCIELEDNEYEIEVKRSLRMRNILITIAHEMVHVKQYELGQLSQNSEREYSYWNKPSEIEAHEIECKLFDQWVKENNLGKYKWTRSNDNLYQ